jgi:hypothetical protein
MVWRRTYNWRNRRNRPMPAGSDVSALLCTQLRGAHKNGAHVSGANVAQLA